MSEPAATTLLPRATCPHCWHLFEPQDALWIATHPSLRGDPRLQGDAYRRFLPSRFTVKGGALDEASAECTQLACPNCHLHVPRLCLELKPWFASIFGAQATGKSYLLAAMTYMLRRRLPAGFNVSFTDSDASANQYLVGFEQKLFYNPTPEEFLPLAQLIDKTQESGDPYEVAKFGNEFMEFPRPYMFTIRPQNGHPMASDPDAVSSMLCLYDNAGESFEPGRDSAIKPVTRHLVESSLLMFLFDPTQHLPFRRKLASIRTEIASDRPLKGDARQDQVLIEVGNRIRRFSGMRDTDKTDRPLIVIVTKLDLWEPLVAEYKTQSPMIASTRSGASALNLDRVEELSKGIRRLLAEHAPEVVTAAESLARTVTYMGVSALGVLPVHHPNQRDKWAVRPIDVQPMGVEMPILYGLNQQFPRLIPGGRRSGSRST
jgi:hypothetical protein